MNSLASVGLLLLFGVHLCLTQSTSCKGYSVIVKSVVNGAGNNMRFNDPIQITLYPNCTAFVKSSFTMQRGLTSGTAGFDVYKVAFFPALVYFQRNIDFSEILTITGYEMDYPITKAGLYVGNPNKLIDLSKYAGFLPFAIGDAIIRIYVYYDGQSTIVDTVTVYMTINKTF